MSNSLWPMDHTIAGFPILHYFPEFASTRVHCVGDAIQPSHLPSSPSPPALHSPSIRVFANESALQIKWPKYWSFSFNISPSTNNQGWFLLGLTDFLAVQGTLTCLLWHHTSKAPLLRSSAFFMVPLCHPYMTTGKTIELSRFCKHSVSNPWDSLSGCRSTPCLLTLPSAFQGH